jgi:thiol:disulfide interchange protein
MTPQMVGWVLLVLALIPALSQKVQTGVTSALGLWLLALAGIALIAGTGEGVREWLLCVGLVLAVAGEVMHWRRTVSPRRARSQRTIDAARD